MAEPRQSEDPDEAPQRPPTRTPHRSPDPRRFPAWLAIPVATLGGYMAADWPGALFGVVAGYFLWRARR